MTQISTTTAAQARRSGTAVRRLLSTPLGVAALVADVILVLLVIFAPILWGDAAADYDTSALSQGPSREHLFGTDQLGRDIGLRVLVATRLSVLLALGATVIGVVIGLVLGLAPTVVGPRVGGMIVAGINMAVAFPGLLLALFFAAIFGVGPQWAMLALGLASAPGFARLTHTLAAGVAGRDFVSAARVMGIGRVRTAVRHILPNISETLVVNATLGAAGALLAFAGLSFLGLGVQQPSYDWGRMLGDGLGRIYINPLAALAPGLAIVLAGLALNLTGEAAAQVVSRRVVLPRSSWLVGHRRTSRVAEPSSDQDVLVATGLRVEFPGPGGEPMAPVRGVDLRIARGESVGIVGESGSGKSLTALALAQLVQEPARVTAGRLEFDGLDLQDSPKERVRHHLGTRLAMVFQDPMSSLNPVIRIGTQLAEGAVEHRGLSWAEAREEAVGRLQDVRVPGPQDRVHQYPHEFSGGMRQRAMIAMGLMVTPTLLVADEPTTALDVTVQQKVLQVLRRIRRQGDTALLLISHDVAVVTSMCDRVLVMYAGRVVEELTVEQLLDAPRHPYTRALLATVPDMQIAREHPLATIPGRPPHPSEVPTGCAYAARCPFATSRCDEDPALAAQPDGSKVACWHPQAGALQRFEENP